ncbi:MAG: class I SAM-dependent methyltransferase [Caldilineales bacterium]
MTDYEIEYQKNPSACGDPFPEIVAFFDGLSLSEARVLDIGCGQGRDALMIARYGHRVDGVDISPTGIGQMLARAQAENLRVNGKVEDVRRFLPDGNYDVVLLDRVVHMLGKTAEKIALLEKAQQATAEEGFVLISDTPSNMSLIETAFRDHKSWTLVCKKTGFRFFQRAA